MCNWLLYYGIPTVPYGLLFKTHNKFVISTEVADTYANDARETESWNQSVNVHGSGLGWYMISHNINRRNYRDRYGLTLWESPKIYTGSLPPAYDRNLRRLSEATETSMFFAHVRSASPFSPVHEWNSHPFKRGRYMFMHHGYIANFDNIKYKLHQKISDRILYKEMTGTSDSETFFTLFLSFLPNSDFTLIYSAEVLKKALIKTLALMESETKGLELWNDDYDTYSDGRKERKYRSLMNVSITDGEKVIVLRYATGTEENSEALWYCHHEGYHIEDPDDICPKLKNISSFNELRKVSMKPKRSTTTTTTLSVSSDAPNKALNTLLVCTMPLDRIDEEREKRNWKKIQHNTLLVIDPVIKTVNKGNSKKESVERCDFENSFMPGDEKCDDSLNTDYEIRAVESKVTLEMLLGRTEGTNDLQLGCEIHVYEDIVKVKAAFKFRLIDQEKWKWDDSMKQFLGKKFNVVEIPVVGVVGLRNKDKLAYFPTGAIYLEEEEEEE